MIPQPTIPGLVEGALFVLASLLLVAQAAGLTLPAIPAEWQPLVTLLGYLLSTLLRGGQHVAKVQAAQRRDLTHDHPGL